jgi:hypothetical protein
MFRPSPASLTLALVTLAFSVGCGCGSAKKTEQRQEISISVAEFQAAAGSDEVLDADECADLCTASAGLDPVTGCTASMPPEVLDDSGESDTAEFDTAGSVLVVCEGMGLQGCVD